ncbi:hypothetical protein Micbo1qcDRAFT_773 [Microdochium bolleyi]|uniref:C2H2-type domain-containing protein n=1 Tax=Microdochium bolleyi TaxID=196109 RepID=A0A136JGY7_9PEZI|nr:hypothetical protein Micbo1qcDRAFT_773 [Microdochium bolleyi]
MADQSPPQPGQKQSFQDITEADDNPPSLQARPTLSSPPPIPLLAQAQTTLIFGRSRRLLLLLHPTPTCCTYPKACPKSNTTTSPCRPACHCIPRPYPNSKRLPGLPWGCIPGSRSTRRVGSTDSQKRECPHCGREFKRSEHLERHVRTHTKEKPYICHCGSAFSRRDLLTRHARIVHQNASQSPEDVNNADEAQSQSSSDHPLGSAGSFVPHADQSGGQWPQSPQYAAHAAAAQSQDAHLGSGSMPYTYPQHMHGSDYDTAPPIGGFEQFRDFVTSVDSNNVHAPWYPEFYDPQTMVDPALQASHVPEVSSPYVQTGTVYHGSYFA